ncbi:WD40 repeat domain-containing protein [Streptomyces luteolus]|uniref:WD40 repeat domain-containing protein n=1 Tax=Streptomyces luteolus TaxID=3043615 RepID=A0ABT6T7F1_9ACTN|nr:WD40 repeat domain-containing protein [Streptomyces sp. B-S-A12]MDI3423827.1 WD40 repeat domain-containing protein [Streptomyces sp. B-S-A12]
MIKHQGPISGIAAFQNRYVATAGYDNQVILWDAALHTPLARALHDHLANQVSFSPDGTLLVTSSSDYSARLWSLPDMRLKAVLPDHKDDVEMSVFHPQQELIATASRDHIVRVHDFTGTVHHRFEGHTADVISVEWLPDTDELLSSSDDGTIKRWSLATGEMTADIDLEGVETDTIAITRSGVVFAGNDDGAIIRIEDVEDGNSAHFPAHDAGIKRLVHHPATGNLVSLSYDRSMKIWDTSESLRLVDTTEFPAEIWARSCAFLDDHTLVFATFGSTYATYDTSTRSWDLTGVEGTRGVNAVTTLADGSIRTVGDAGTTQVDGVPATELGSLCNFLVGVGDRVLAGGQLGQIFDAATGEVLHRHRSPLNCAASFERDGVPHVVVGTYTGEGLVFAVPEDGTALDHVATLPLHSNAVKGVAVSDGTIFAVCADTAASWFDTATLRETGRVQEAHTRIANGCAPLPGGRFASVSRDLLLRLWTEDRAVALPTPHEHSIKCVAASSDGRLVATGSYAGTVAVYDTRAQAWTHISRPTAAGISSLHYAPESDRFLAGSYDGSVYPVRADREGRDE